MNLTIKRLSRFYAWLTGFYPFSFRQEFALEMQMVFREKLSATRKAGNRVLYRVFWKELRSLPLAILTEYWFAFRETLRRGIMSLLTENKTWHIEDRRNAILASLPPVMMGFGIALGALVIWKPWYTIPNWRLLIGFVLMMLPGLIIGLGGIWTLIKHIPPWGYTWVGAAAMGLILFVKTLAEERADSGLPLLSPVLDNLIAILLLLGIMILIGIFAWRGWRQAGLISLGFATMAGMSSFSMATAAPLNRYDLALLAAPVGLVMSLLMYLYVRKGDLGRVISIAVFGLLNTVMLLVVAKAWELPTVHAFPIVPFLVVLTGALLVGPLAGLVGRPVRKVIRGS